MKYLICILLTTTTVHSFNFFSSESSSSDDANKPLSRGHFLPSWFGSAVTDQSRSPIDDPVQKTNHPSSTIEQAKSSDDDYLNLTSSDDEHSSSEKSTYDYEDDYESSSMSTSTESEAASTENEITTSSMTENVIEIVSTTTDVVNGSTTTTEEPEKVVVISDETDVIPVLTKSIFQKSLEWMEDAYTLSILLPIGAGILFAVTCILTIACCRCMQRCCRRRRYRNRRIPDAMKGLSPSDKARLLGDFTDDEF